MRKVNTLLIGVGAHAKRIYLPFLKVHKSCNLAACVDIEVSREKATATLKELGIVTDSYFIKDPCISDSLSAYENEFMDGIVEKHKIEAVIISTEPLSHFKYARWALNKNLHILLDKPISTEINISVDPKKARKIFKDYKTLINLYRKKNINGNLVFSIQAQRRFHIGFQTARRKIIEIAKLSNCPVTFIQTFHSDGQWTFPNEFINQTYHPYNQGYGKMSHSGFHSLDIALWLVEASLKKDKKWDNYKVSTSFVRPKDILSQFSRADYMKIFPGINLSPTIAEEILKVTGEVDAFTHLSLLDGNNIITSIDSNSLHNSFSRRGWFDSTGKDLYKGNGRVRQESYIIEQGPFQSIVINSLQAEEIQKENLHPYEVGGEYHFDIHVFRNKNVYPELQAYEYLNLQTLKPVHDFGYSRGHQEDARRNCLFDFYQSIIGNVPADKQGSNILYHALTTQVLSSIYVSAANQYIGRNGVVSGKINNRFSDKSYV